MKAKSVNPIVPDNEFVAFRTNLISSKHKEEMMGENITKKAIPIIIVFAIFLALMPVVSMAQDLPLLTLENCIDKGLNNDPLIIQSKTYLKQSANNMWLSYGSFLPDVILSSSYDYNTDYSFYDVDSYNSRLSISRYGFRGFTEYFDLQASRKSQLSYRESYNNQVLNSVYNIRTGYFNVLKAMKLADVQRKSLERSEEQLRITETRYELGSAALSDVLKAKVSRGEAKLNLISAENGYLISMAYLNYLIGDDVTRKFRVDSAIGIHDIEFSLDGALEYALENNPNLKSYKLTMESSKNSVRSNWTDLLPYLNLSYTASWYNPDEFAFGDVFGKGRSTRYSIGVGINIFDRFITKRNISNAKATYSNDEFNYFNQLNALKLEVTESYLNLEKAQLSMEVAGDKLASAQEDYKLAQEKYSLGAATILDLLDAELSLKTAESDVIESEYNLNLAVANLEKALGITEY